MISPNDPTAEVVDVVYDAFTSAEQTKKEINFITSQLKKGKTILDVGCGSGRHVLPLLKKGYQVIGLDNSKGMLKLLKEKLEKNNLQTEIIYKDIRKIKKFDQKFAGIICFWGAFCEIAKTEQEARNVLELFLDSLDTGGKLIIDIFNPKVIKPEALEYKSKVKKEGQIYETSFKAIKFDKETNITTSKELIEIKENRKIIKKLESEIVQRWWRKEELEKLAKKVGFSKIELFGDDFLPFKKSSERMVLVATK
ncbi:methyltransferase domain-containing protein [Candidatus Woesearchaeota archaeon]|nr:methyltransferase domain-containing protein [Candidatus Woesearchaeota archaeon]